MTELFAFDIGNKQTKMVSRLRKEVYPSYFMLHEDLGSAVTIFDNDRNINKYETSIDSEFEYAWGKGINQVNTDKYIDTISFDNRYSSNEFKLLVDFALAEIAKDFEEAKTGILECVVSTGVPSNDYHENELKSIISVFKGDHNIKVNGESYNIRVKEVFVMEQPIGTIYNEMLDCEGFIKNESFMEENIVVVDIGGGTLLIDTLKSLNIDHKQSDQRDNGVYDLYERVKDMAKKRGIKGLTEYKIEQIIRKGNSNDGYFYKPNKNESIDLTDIIQAAEKIYTREIINAINTTLKDKTQLDKALFTGGGPNVLNQSEIKKVFSHYYFVEDSETATVNGYFKYLKAMQQAAGDGELA